jgi:hypothetical protein
MRKISALAASAFINDRNFKLSNTEVIANGAITGLYLFGNLIAERNKVDNTLYITSAGWETNTTRERLNALYGVRIAQKKGIWYLNGNVWKHPELLTKIR